MADLEVLYACFAGSQGSGIPKPPWFTLWPSISLWSVLTSSPPKVTREKASLRVSYIRPIILTTPGTVLFRYCHLSWINTPKTAYAKWGYHLNILARLRTPWFHASTLGLIQAYSYYLGPKYDPRYWLPTTYLWFKPARSNSCRAASLSSGLSAINSNLDGSGK